MTRNRCSHSAFGLLSFFVAVFALTVPASAEWKEKVLYSFQGLPNDGAYPAGGVVFDKAGNLYGATTSGGANDCPGIAQCGIVFQLQAPAQKGGAWSEHVLYVFKGVNFNDGDAPVGGVIFDQAGNLYGTTAYGGTGKCELFGGRVGCGTVYELVPPKKKGGAWTERVVYSFQSGKDGYFPWGDLTFDIAGNLCGATQYGGGYGSCNAPYYQYCGTVFKMSPPKTKDGKWKEQVLYAFKSGKDGANPNGGLVFDSKGAIYGTTYIGGYNCPQFQGVGCGTVFMLTPLQSGKWDEQVLHRFTDGEDGAAPNGDLIFDSRGSLYGTAATGGVGNAWGVVSKMAPPSGSNRSWIETVLHVFNTCGRYDPCDPKTGLMFDSSGNLYGTAGAIFRMSPAPREADNWGFSVLYTFTGPPDGFDPGGLVFRGASTIYGTTLDGGTGRACQGGCGTVFEVRP